MTRIILLNFSAKEAHAIANAGYSVDRGFLGKYGPEKYLPFWAPHPLYEYDILFYNSSITSELEKEFTERRNLLQETGSSDTLSTLNGTPSVRVSFVGDSTGLNHLLHGGVSFVHLVKAEDNVSVFLESSHNAFAIADVQKLISGFKSQIAKVGYFFPARDPYPFHHVPALLSRKGHVVAAYGTTYGSDGHPSYILFPQLKNIPLAVIQILKCLENVVPSLFPDKFNKTWLESREFLLPDEREKEGEIEQKIADTLSVVEKLREQRAELAKNNAFIRGLLVATENSKFDPPERLSSVVRQALEFLEFEVEDIDEKTKSAIKKEDFWVKDGDFFGITEVTGTVHTNPKVQEFNAILGRMATLYKRQTDLVLPKAAIVSGLLVLNYDTEHHPAQRPKAYTGELEHIVQSAEENGIGLLSTVELHKIVVSVKEGILSKVEARSLLKKSGRIEFDSTRVRKC
jgi:hypothetical protein